MENTFIKYQEALKILENNKAVYKHKKVSILEAGGEFLAEDFIADRDFPPYDRVTMDGIAINYEAYVNGNLSFPIQEIAPAGAPQKILNAMNACIEIMTGAILPENTDTIIRYEELEIAEGTAKFIGDVVKKQQNIHFQGEDISENAVIKNAGERISSAEINVAASIGKDQILVSELPKTVIISTGDELVDVTELPEAHQIRRSNVYGIRNTLKEWGIPADLKHLADDKGVLGSEINTLLTDYDVLIMTGGVSKGKFDFLPEVLTKLGVTKLFHKVKQRPGKPFWFGKKDDSTHVFALPGNPVSSFVCLYAYVRFWLLRSLNLEEEKIYAELSEDLNFKPDLVYFIQAKVKSTSDGKLSATPVFGNGSGDFANLVHADGFLILPQGKDIFNKGEVYPFIPYRIKI